MSRKGWLTVGLSLLLGTGFAGALPGRAIGHTIVAAHGARVEAARWGDANGEGGEVESPRWGDSSGEQGEVESPRSGYRSGEQTDAGSPRA